MLTENMETTIATLAREIDFIEYHSHPPPDDKATFVENLVSPGATSNHVRQRTKRFNGPVSD